MSSASSLDIKRALVGAGLEVYRTRGAEVHLADRVRDNLILDSGVVVGVGETLRVRFIVRAQKSDFPHERPEILFDRARELARAAAADGWSEQSSQVTAVTGPVDPSRTLDTWFEVMFERAFDSVDDAVSAARFALRLEKYARPDSG